MRDALLDIVKVITVLDFEIVKVTGDDEGDVLLQSRKIDETSGSVMFYGKLNKKIPEFAGVFGLNNINMLSGLTNVDSFKDKDAKISMKRIKKGEISVPEELVFEKAGFGKASYRLTSEKAIPQQAKVTGEIKWDVTVDQPAKRKITEFAQMAGIYSNQESRFSVKTDDVKLIFLIGSEDGATHKAHVVFADAVKGSINADFTWHIGGILNVMKLGSNSNMTIRISSQGIFEIGIDTGLGVYTFLFTGSK